MDPVIEGNHGKNSKRKVTRILCLSQFGETLLQFTFYFYEGKQNKCVHALYCDIITVKEDCCWLIFVKTKY